MNGAVTQADRDALADILIAMRRPCAAEDVRLGKCDVSPTLAIVARHREAETERCENAIRNCRQPEIGGSYDRIVEEAIERAIEAIRSTPGDVL